MRGRLWEGAWRTLQRDSRSRSQARLPQSAAIVGLARKCSRHQGLSTVVKSAQGTDLASEPLRLAAIPSRQLTQHFACMSAASGGASAALVPFGAGAASLPPCRRPSLRPRREPPPVGGPAAGDDDEAEGED